jgi:hypothetical protein
MDRNELYEVELHMRKMADATRESIDMEERLESPSWSVARDAVNLAVGGLDRGDAIGYLRDELARLETDPFIARKVISECERRLYWREQRLETYEREWGEMAERNRRNAAAETPEHVIDPEIMDAIKAEARGGVPAGHPKSAIGMAAVARVAAQATATASQAPPAPATPRAAVPAPAPAAEPAAAPAGGQRPARGRP